MEMPNGIVTYEMAEYGYIKVKLASVMERHGITRNHLRTLTGVKYDVIDRYYKGCNIASAALDFLAKVCCVLNCHIEDILEYVPPVENNK